MRELASAYERVGSVQGQYLQNSLGDTSGSLRSNQQGLALRQKISAGSKEWTDQLALAHSYRLVANQLWATGDQRGAAASNERAIAISEALQHSRPGERKVLDELVTDYSFASDIHQKTHANWVADWTLARDYMMKATTIDEAILKNDPEDIDWQRGYGVDLLQLGQILKLQLHDGPGALEQYAKALKIHQAILLKQPTPQHRRDVAVIYNHMASVNEDLFGDYKQARASNVEALRLYQDAIAQDPSNAMLQQGLAIAYANLGLDEAVAGDRSSASLDLDQGIAVMKALVERSPANLQQQGYLAAMYSNRGDVRLRLHDAEGALRDYETARDVNRRIVAQSKDANVDTFLAGCELGIASAFKQKGKLEPASAALS